MKHILVAVFLLLFTSFAHGDEVAITFDDLPGQEDMLAEHQEAINKSILQALKKFNAPAIGFVNEGKLYSKGQTKEKISILKLWVDYGQPLGNHTYSHKALSRSKPGEFQKDVIKGAKISKKLMEDAGMAYHYFRHPYLDTGTTKQMRISLEVFLKKNGYIIAPATIDTDDWKFNQQLLETPKDKEKILNQYLAHTRAKFVFYKAASEKIFGRNIRQTWLLHVNALNSYAMEDLLKMAAGLGYKFVTLDRALEDKVYLEPDNYYAPFGVSWFYRWDFTRGKVVDWSQDPEPDNNPFIQAKSLKFFDKFRNRSVPVEMYVSGESESKANAGISKLPVVIINNGYGAKNTEYSSIADALAARGYFVVSIQHDLDTDVPLPRTGNLFERRKPLWERGVQNILFVIKELKKSNPSLALDKVTLIGHSNGGDISMMFTDLYPESVTKVISLDSLRYPFPIKNHIPILSLRANDTKADDGVLPKSGATIVNLEDVKHIELCDRGSSEVKQRINDLVTKFMESK